MVLKNMKIRNKLMVAFILVVFLPVFLVSFFLTVKMKNMAIEQSFKEAENEVDRVHANIEELINFNVAIQNTILADHELYEVVNHEYTSSLEIFKAYSNYKRIEEYERNYEGIIDIRVYVDNPSLLNNMDIMSTSLEDKESRWYEEAKLWRGKVVIFYHQDKIKRKNYLLLAKYHKMKNGKEVVIMTLLGLEYLNKLLENERLNIQVLDVGNTILATTEEEEREKKFYDVTGVYVAEKVELNREYYRNELAQPFQQTIKTPHMALPVYIVSLIPLAAILEPANKATSFSMLVMVFILLGSVIVIFGFSNFLTKKITGLVKNIQQIAKGNFQIVNVYKEKDEIGELSKNLYQMSHSLSDLINENLMIKEKEKRMVLATEQIKFKMLASQINPHFLFNVLESLRMKAYMNEDKEIAEGIKILGKLMRRSIEMTSELVTVEEEISFVSQYMTLQKFRFGERIDYKVYVKNKDKGIKILPLLIQPIIENAFIHGLGSITEDGMVELKVYREKREEEFLMIEISDNGDGIKKADLYILRNSLKKEEEWVSDQAKHIGLRNVSSRLDNYYGKKSEVIIESEWGKGTVVKIKIPLEVENASIDCR